ncbi:zinc finger, CCHC-type, retrotransposon gag domain protein [Tanacetum coccineum]
MAEEARKVVEEAKKNKKANEDAERRRKAVEDKRVRDGCSYKSFLNCKPSEFHEDSDSVIVTNWLREIEDVFEISEDSPRQRMKYASYLLKGDARHWWNMIKIAHGDDVESVVTWEEFEDLVMENYCPQGLMDKLEEEFLKLQQNDMKGPVQQARSVTFQEAVELDLMVEKENNRQLEEGGDNKRKRENQDDDVIKIKTNSGIMENVWEYKLCTIYKKTNKGECWHDNCRNCGKSSHTSKECKVE